MHRRIKCVIIFSRALRRQPVGKTTYTVSSPLMGTFYRASNPDDAPLVKKEQHVEASQVVCIIESMKIFTELRTEKSGIVKSILVDNEDPVMKNQPLIEIEVDLMSRSGCRLKSLWPTAVRSPCG